jgi:amino acid adenylation domain-containing protein
MNCLVVEYGQTLYFLLKYSSKLFKPDTVERMARYFRNALAEVAAHKERHLAEIQITSPRERDKLLYHLNQTGTALPREKSIQHVFEKQVRKSPDSIAIICADKRLTYRQLNQKSEQTAHLLKGKGLGPDIVAGLMTERSAEAIIGVLGILKAGGAYLPLDPQYPEERIAYILADSGARVLLTGHATTVKVKEKLLEIVDISGFLAFAAPAPSPSSEEAHGTNLAYVIYTSGSTGRPKGVMIEHTSVLRLVINSNYIDLKETDRILPTGAFVFDIATFETWWPLLHGISMYIEPKDTILEPGTLGNLLVKNNITVLHLTPQLFNQLAARDIGIFAGLRVFLVGGDLVTPGYVNLLKNTCRHLKILHMYGPTENTTFSTFFEVDRDYGTGIPLGKPISNSTVYILDKNLNLQPLGVAGELCVGGSGVARGYLNQPELTFEKFCLRRAGGSFCKNRPLHPHKNVLSGTPAQPAHPRTDATVYLTGDLARWLPEENIEFLGRMDHQLKIRGIRVEIHEIQNRLLSHEEVKEAVVVDREDSTGDKYLCAYIVPLSNRVMGEIKGFLSRSLPDYMIPAYFLELESLPLTPNGKLDRKRLPQPLFAQGENHYPPRTRTERKLAEIWSGILARDPLPAPFSPGIDDNFFELGGHSLKAIILAAKIHKEFNVKLPLAKIFAFPTIRELAERIETSAQYKYITVAAAEKKEYYPLSPAQKRLFFLQQMDLHSIAYNMPYLLPVKKGTAKEKLEEIFAKLISRHEILRTSFTMLDGEPVQQVHPRVEFSLHSHNREPEPRLRPSPPDRPPGIKDFVRPFALSRPPLLRAALLDIDGPEPTGGTARLLLIDIHHILTDGISEKILRDEFAALSSHRELAPTRIQYKDYSQWQKTQTRKNELRLQEEYWLREFQEEIPPLNLPLDYRRPAPRSLEGHSIAFELGENETGTLNALARAQGVTLFMLLLAIFNVLLAKLSNQEDVIVGTPTAGRRHPDLERVIGMFVNTLVLRNFPADEKKFVRFLADLRQRTLEAFENQDYQFEELVEKVVKGRDVRHNPLFDVMFDLRNIYETSPPGTEEETGKSPENKGENPDSKNLLSISKFDLILSAFEDRRKLFLTFRYGSKLFKRQTILGFIAYFRNLVAAIIQDPQRQIETLEIITGEERKRLLYDFNDAQADYPQDKVIQQLFAEQSRRVPHATALVGTGVQELTYGELNRKADRLGWFLRNKGVGPDTIVGIMVHPSPEMILWIMAILKAGGAYMPISPEYPAERKKLMLSESRVKWLLSREPNPGHFPETCEVVNPETLDLPAGVEKKPGNLNTPGDLAYTLYTSGSTGNPKGMLISHRNVVRLLFNDKFPFAFKEDDVWTLFHSFCFDFSVWEMYGALLYGGKLVIVPQPVARDTEKFLGLLKRQQVTVLNQTPAAFYNLVNLELKQSQRELRIRYVIFGGEALAPAMLREWYAAYPATRLINMYGITETTVHVTLKEITSAEIATNTGNIGKPIPTMSIYLIGKSLRLIPPGVAGELCVGGDGVGRGYLNRPELSAEKFISLSYLSPAAKNKLYRSGDLARWLAHGELEYLGRIDRQVKIRGYRIELAEIESQLANYENITKVIVRTRDSNPEAPRKYSSPNDNTGEYGDKYLCAYFVATKRIEAAPLKEYLAGRLPAYMIPAYFLQLEKMPLTLNGKIDRKALPDPKKIPGIIGWDKNNRLPENETEEKIRQIWGEVLGIAPQTIGVEEDFFELGGNSINILKVANIIGHQLEVELALGELFLSPTIRALATRIQQETMRQNLESVVKLSESTSPKNMFILHQGEGLIYPYKKLAALLEDELNVYGIQAKGLFQKSQLPENMEMMLAHYLREIKIVQPQGPYLIAGYCMGNRIAYELVRCLEDGNDAVTKLIIFNTAPFISEFRLRRLRLKESVLKTVTRGSASPRIKTRAIPSPREDNTPIAPEEIEKRKEEVRNNLAAINEKYKPQRIINTPIVVLKAHANPNPKCNAASWSKMTTAGATVIETPGGHNTMFSIPFVNKMAKRITKIIRGVER